MGRSAALVCTWLLAVLGFASTVSGQPTRVVAGAKYLVLTDKSGLSIRCAPAAEGCRCERTPAQRGWARHAAPVIAVPHARTGACSHTQAPWLHTHARTKTTCPGKHRSWQNVNFIQAELAAAGAQFDTVAVDSGARPNFSSLLWNPDGAGRYRGYVM